MAVIVYAIHGEFDGVPLSQIAEHGCPRSMAQQRLCHPLRRQTSSAHSAQHHQNLPEGSRVHMRHAYVTRLAAESGFDGPPKRILAATSHIEYHPRQLPTLVSSDCSVNASSVTTEVEIVCPVCGDELDHALSSIVPSNVFQDFCLRLAASANI